MASAALLALGGVRLRLNALILLPEATEFLDRDVKVLTPHRPGGKHFLQIAGRPLQGASADVS